MMDDLMIHDLMINDLMVHDMMMDGQMMDGQMMDGQMMDGQTTLKKREEGPKSDRTRIVTGSSGILLSRDPSLNSFLVSII